MDLTFYTVFENGVPTWFNATALKKEEEAVSWFFSFSARGGLEECYDVLNILEEIDQRNGGNMTLPLMNSAGASLRIEKDECVFRYDISYGGPGEVNMPTNEFKALLLRWIKFMEINIEEFRKQII